MACTFLRSMLSHTVTSMLSHTVTSMLSHTVTTPPCSQRAELGPLVPLRPCGRRPDALRVAAPRFRTNEAAGSPTPAPHELGHDGPHRSCRAEPGHQPTRCSATHHQKHRVRRRHGRAAIGLPRFHPDVGDPPALASHQAARVGIDRCSRAQVVDGQRDGLGQNGGLGPPHRQEPVDRRCLLRWLSCENACCCRPSPPRGPSLEYRLAPPRSAPSRSSLHWP